MPNYINVGIFVIQIKVQK